MVLDVQLARRRRTGHRVTIAALDAAVGPSKLRELNDVVPLAPYAVELNLLQLPVNNHTVVHRY
jgi:hypothetical protein